MNKLTPQEIAKVFGLYPMATTYIYDVEGTLFDSGLICCERTTFEASQVKLYLKPFHHMPSEDIIDACRFYDNTGFMGAIGKTINIVPKGDEPFIKQIYFGSEWPYTYTIDLETGGITMFKTGRPFNTSGNILMMPQWFCKHNYAIPIYFDDDHWANGKTAIELELAVPDRSLLLSLLNKKYKGDKSAINEFFFHMKLLGTDLNKIRILDEAIEELKAELKL